MNAPDPRLRCFLSTSKSSQLSSRITSVTTPRCWRLAFRVSVERLGYVVIRWGWDMLGLCSDCEVPRDPECQYAQHDIDAASTSNQTCEVLPVQSAESRFELQLSGTGTAAICGEDHRTSCELQEPVSHIISNHFNSCHASTYLFRNLFIYFNFNNFSPAVSSDLEVVSCTWSPMDSHGLHMSAYFCRSKALPLPRAGIGHWIFLATQRGRKGGWQRLDWAKVVGDSISMFRGVLRFFSEYISII